MATGAIVRMEAWQMPLTQVWSTPHTLPHAPQLFTSPCRFEQYGAPPSPPQSDCPERQPGTQVPAEQASPEGQAVPQTPQLALSVCVLAQ